VRLPRCQATGAEITFNDWEAVPAQVVVAVLSGIETDPKCVFRETLLRAKGTIRGTGRVPGPPRKNYLFIKTIK
jgi:hypothetical protein